MCVVNTRNMIAYKIYYVHCFALEIKSVNFIVKFSLDYFYRFLKNFCYQKPADKPHPQISRTLNLTAKILEKKVFWKKSKEIQSRVLRSLLHPVFIAHKLTINIATENTSKSYPQFYHFNKMNIVSTNFDI